VLTACLIALAGYLHSHVVAVVALLVISAVCIALIAFDVGSDRAARKLATAGNTVGGSWDGLNKYRERLYADRQGLFLVHSWVPSEDPEQVADVTVALAQHGPGPLASGRVAAVEYAFGPKFEHHSVTREHGHDGFAVTVSMWGQMLCVARVNFTDGTPPLILERYITFEGSRA